MKQTFKHSVVIEKETDLPKQDLLDIELTSWKQKWLEFVECSQPTSLEKSS